MRLTDTSSLLDHLINKFRSWVSWGTTSCGIENEMPGDDRYQIHPDHDRDGVGNHKSIKYSCRGCGRVFSEVCIQGSKPVVLDSGSVRLDHLDDAVSIKCCKFCGDAGVRRCEGKKKNFEKVHPRDSPEPPSPCFSGSEKTTDCSMNSESIRSDSSTSFFDVEEHNHFETGSSTSSFSAHPSPVSVGRSPRRYRSDEEMAEDPGRLFFSPSSEHCRNIFDLGTRSFSSRHDFYYRSVGSSPSDSPSRIGFISNRGGHTVQQEKDGSPICRDGPSEPEAMASLLRPHRPTEDAENSDYCSDDMSLFRAQYEKSEKQMDFENNGFIWYPPPPNDENDEAESNSFQYDDDDDDVGESAAMFSSSSSLSSIFPSKERQQDVTKEPLRALVQAHFRALVSQLLHGEGIKTIEENGAEEWIDVVTNIAWQAANFVKPDTSRGGSMDPCDYVKVKCVASGSPSESTVVKGVVCTKNIKHKRMTSQYKNPRILILGGSLEYQRSQNELASFNTLLQQEIDHLKMIISKIEALHPNVLLVEKSVSSYAQEYLLEKEISLVLNVKRPLLERISKCTGAVIIPSIESISTTRPGHCELFRLERVSEEHQVNSQSSKKPSKTLMFFEGCPRRLGCTVLLRGTCREELKKVKHVVLFAVFAAYHLSLETCFLADEGATLPKMTLKLPVALSEKAAADDGSISHSATSAVETQLEIMPNAHGSDDTGVDSSEIGGVGTNFKRGQPSHGSFITAKNQKSAMTPSGAQYGDPYSPDSLESYSHAPFKNIQNFETLAESHNFYQPEFLVNMTAPEPKQSVVLAELDNCERIEENGMSGEYFSATDTNQSILVSFSSRCVLKGTVCERSRLLRIKFYGCFDKPLGRYLRDDLFDQTSYCRSCKEPAEAHVLCYTHQQGNLTVNVKHIPSMKLPGEVDGKIWMWHRCLKCAHVNGVPPATRRVVMSDAAWGLSFGKFLELSFSNHATANRVATCGHSLQRDCLRYYGFGSMVAFFRYSPIDILSVCLPPSMLEFNGLLQQEWLRKEVIEIIDKVETFYLEISGVLERVEQKSISVGYELLDTSELRNYIAELKDDLKKEKANYNDLLDLANTDSSESGQFSIDILELNRLQQSLLIDSHIWNRRLYSLNSLVETKPDKNVGILGAQIRELRIDLSFKDGSSDSGSNSNASTSSNVFDDPANDMHLGDDNPAIKYNGTSEEEITRNTVFSETLSSDEPNLSERIDSAWTGSDHVLLQNQAFSMHVVDGVHANAVGHVSGTNSPSFKRLKSPVRVNSFDSALRLQERFQRAMLPSSIPLTTLGSFHASGDYRHMVRDPLRYSFSNVMRTYSQMLPRDTHKLSALSSTPAIISSASLFTASARMLLPQTGHNDIVIAVYDDEPTSIISYALSSKEYEDWVCNKMGEHGGDLSGNLGSKEGVAASSFSTWQSFGAMDMDNIPYTTYGSEDATSSVGALFREPKKSAHLPISFGDESSSAGGKARFLVTCYFAKQFDSLRQKCCPCELDFIRSLSRCKRWSAEGGKSNVYFAKSMDERFIIKQVTKTELDSFVEFAPEYFKYLNDCLSSGSPTCLAKILGLYQVTVKHLKGSKETKMDLMVMENLFFKRSISWTYDLKGSSRSRYNPDTSGKNKVLWDMNLLEALRTKPIFLGSKAKRRLERAIWNDTAFLASVDVMDYSLLVGVDEERQELVLGIIDFMRQYTWDKHLETWVKASGILGGPKNASPTIVSPKQYKKRFRKAMTSYFLTVPDQWSS